MYMPTNTNVPIMTKTQIKPIVRSIFRDTRR